VIGNKGKAPLWMRHVVLERPLAPH
jgi:hypothetical protein